MIAKKDYKPKKTPAYLGINVKGDEKTRIQNIVRYSLAKIQQSTNSESVVNEDSAEFNHEALTSWKWPEGGYHVTTCFVGSDKTATTSEAYKFFEEG